MSDNSRQLAVLPRPRSAWQAIDAGMLLARTHYWKLLALWLFFAIPVVSLIFALIKFEVVGYWLLVFGLVVQAFERITHTDVPITGFI